MEKGLLWLTVVGIVLHHSGILAVDAVCVRGADTACTVRRERGMLFSLLPFTLFRSMAHGTVVFTVGGMYSYFCHPDLDNQA